MAEALGDYGRKSGFSKVVLGLSGEANSAVTAVITADGVGPANVRRLLLPSDQTPPAPGEDAAEVARRLGCLLDEVPIEQARLAMRGTVRSGR